MRALPVNCVPRELTINQNYQRIDDFEPFLKLFEAERNTRIGM